MQPKGHRAYYFVLAAALPILLLICLRFTRPIDAASSAVGPVQYVAFIGSESDIDAYVAPFYYNNSLRFIRQYHTPQPYLDEAPAPFFPVGATPTDATIRLFKLMVSPSNVPQTISDLHAAIQPVSDTVKISTDELKFLSHLPGQIIVHGDCNAMDNLAGTYGILFKKEIELSYLPISPTPCVHLYETPGTMVDIKIAQINSANINTPPAPPFYPDIWAERNYLSSSYMGNHFIFGSGGLILDGATGPNVPVSPLSTKGEGVRVALFDTSPYTIEQGEINADIDGHIISVRHDLPLPSGLPKKSSFANNIAVHGTFVATPIVKMAPSADVLLNRVLDDQGMGDSFTLYLGIHQMMSELSTSSNDYRGAVFNYSLGLDIEDHPEQSALYRLLTYVNQQGIVQVAASGNGSAAANAVQPMTLPASHPSVIGVAALASNGVIACYSNAGNFAIPGGGAARGAADCNMDIMVEACANSSNNDCVTGWNPYSTTTGWAWSVGTSFAAPIATGFVAQIIELIAARPRAAGHETVQQFVSPADVLVELESAATASSNSGAESGVLFGTTIASAIGGMRGEINSAEIQPITLLLPLLLLTFATFLYLNKQRR
ncbi:MAG: S8 family serine peptidase [Candidatus Promineifilaceae bacterium]